MTKHSPTMKKDHMSMPSVKKVHAFGPMLVPSGKLKHGLEGIKFPVLASPKLDGVRALVRGGVLVSRKLLPIPNAHVQGLFAGLPEGTDGELIEGACNDDPYRRTVSAVMSEDDAPDVCFHIFDNYAARGGFSERYASLSDDQYNAYNVIRVPHSEISTVENLQTFEQSCLDLGFEGAMVRSLDGPYKPGRCTEKEGYLLKVKRSEDSEAIVLACYEEMTNENEAEKDELGHTKRSSCKAGMIPAGTLGGFEVRDRKTGVEFKVAATANLKDADRLELWKQRKTLVGKTLVYKFFPTGSKEKPRFPTFKGWRSPIDM